MIITNEKDLSAESDNWFHQTIREEDKRTFDEVLEWLVTWAIHRGIYSEREVGFLSPSILRVMVAVSFQSATQSSLPIRKFEMIKYFFRFFARWKYNECSVAGDCCGLSSERDGSLIDDGEGIDSDVDGPIDSKGNSANEENGETHGLSGTADDNDEVHPHKRQRYELGQIRDVRRFYDVENEQVERISISMDRRRYPSCLDFLDSMSVMDPSNESINLAIKVLESHKKLILQEVVRAESLLGDSIGDDEDVTIGPGSLVLEKVPLRDSSCYLVFKISGESPEIISEVCDIVEDQSWFLIQELQGFHGVMVIPHVRTGSSRVVVGINFIRDEPYSAKAGVNIDFSGPMSRVLLRSRKQLHGRDDFASRFANRFSIKAALVTKSDFDQTID